jgi:predicted GIY-YIG superfamily endonuclease
MDKYIIREQRIPEDSSVLCAIPKELNETIIEDIADVSIVEKTKNYCYVLYSNHYTYNGYTNDPARRLRQHNGEITGGARATTRHRPWTFMCILTSSDPKFTKNLALSIEWHIRYPTGKRPKPAEYHGVAGRIKSVLAVLPRYSIHFDLYCLPEHVTHYKCLHNCSVYSLNEFTF